jgi:predicted nucleic acid-binding protein
VRVFVDTNVLFSGLHSPRGGPARILDAGVTGSIDVVVSTDVLVELSKTVRSKAPQLLSGVSFFLTRAGVEVRDDPPEADVSGLRDVGFGSDAAIVAAAAQADVDHFCTGDRRLLVRIRQHFPSLHPVSPADLLRLLDDEAHPIR